MWSFKQINSRYLTQVCCFCVICIVSFLNISIISASTIKQLSIEDGLSNRRVLGSAKDSKGYIWFATKTNIDRYDGERFDYYKLSDNEKNRGIKADRANKVYAFTEKSVYVYNDNADDFELLFSLSGRNDYLNNATIISLYFDSQNTLFITTNAGILYNNDKTWLTVSELKNKTVQCFIHTPKGEYLAGTNSGILQFQKNIDNQLKLIKNQQFLGFSSYRIQSLFYDSVSDELWIGTFANGLFVQDLNLRFAPKQILKTTLPIKIITEIDKNQIWAGSDGEGVFIFDKFFKTVRNQLAQGENETDNIGANGIYNIMQDGNKVWISTYTAGIFVYNTSSIVKKLYRHEKFNTNSIIDNHVNVVYEDSQGDIWFGTNKGVSLYSVRLNSWRHFLTQNSNSIENSVILSILEDKSGNIWVGGYATKLYIINKKSGVLTDVNSMKGFVGGEKSYIYSIIQDVNGNIWFGGSVDMLTRYNPTTKEFKKFDVEGVVKILDYDINTLYLSTYRGLYRFDKNSGTSSVIDFAKLPGGEKQISLPLINGLLRDRTSEDVLWISTEGFGLYKYDTKSQQLIVYTRKSGLSSDYVYGMLYDNSDRLWISTEYGLDCFETKTANIQSFFEFDGLSENTFNFLAYCKLRNGDLVFGTPKGANQITPESIVRKADQTFNLRFKGFYLFYEKVRASAPESPLKTSIDETSEINLAYFQHTFSIEFMNLDIANQHRMLYSWKLEGFDDDWNQPTAEHKAIYTNIPAGNYTFKVKAISIDNNKESEVRSIEINKRPPFWASTIAYFIYFGLLGWLVCFLVRYWLNKVDNKFTQDKVKFFVSMAHEIRTPLTLIKAPLNEIDNENLTSEGRSALELARKNTDKLFGMVTQLLDFQKIEADAMKLCVEETHLNVFVDNVISNYSYLAKNKGIDFQKKSEISGELTVWLDRNKVQIMLENLIANAIKYTNKGGYVNVFIEVNESKLILQVSDNGIGIPSRAHSNLFESFYRAQNAASSVEVGTGIGLMFTKKLVELHKGQITFISSENVGSTFRIEIPITMADYSADEIVERKVPVEIVEEQTEDENHHAMHVLLVEDNDELRTYLSKMLRKKYSIAEAANGVEALVILDKEIPDLILSDVLMPEMDGFELCRRVKTNISTCHIPFILLTSLSDREHVMKGLALGADDYITKPFDSIILEGKIKAIFNNRALFRKKYIEKSVSINETNLLNDLNKNFMKKLVDQVEANITNEEFNIDELSAEMAMSRSVFFKKVKSLTGQNPKEFIRDIKMNKAADLLRDHKYSVSEIAYLIGFPNAKYFSTAFKKYYGMTPSMFVEKEKREDSFGEHLVDSDD